MTWDIKEKEKTGLKSLEALANFKNCYGKRGFTLTVEENKWIIKISNIEISGEGNTLQEVLENFKNSAIKWCEKRERAGKGILERAQSNLKILRDL